MGRKTVRTYPPYITDMGPIKSSGLDLYKGSTMIHTILTTVVEHSTLLITLLGFIATPKLLGMMS